jgi:hypothetical protein
LGGKKTLDSRQKHAGMTEYVYHLNLCMRSFGEGRRGCPPWPPKGRHRGLLLQNVSAPPRESTALSPAPLPQAGEGSLMHTPSFPRASGGNPASFCFSCGGARARRKTIFTRRRGGGRGFVSPAANRCAIERKKDAGFPPKTRGNDGTFVCSREVAESRERLDPATSRRMTVHRAFFNGVVNSYTVPSRESFSGISR